MIHRRTIAGLACVAAFLATAGVHAQGDPSRPIRLIVGWPAGGTADGVARTLAPALAQGLGQSVVVDNKPGASGSIGAAEVAAAKPDGYTLGIVFDTQAVNQHLYKQLRYDTFKSFDYVSQLVTAPQILVASNAFPASNVAEFIRYGKANPGKINYASTGHGSSNHLNALALGERAGIRMVHVPYKGGAPALADLAGGQVDIMVVSAPSTIPLVIAGRIKVLGTGSAKVLPQLPQARPISETIPGYEANSWVGLVAPAGLAPEVLARLQNETRKALASKDVSASLAGAGYEVVGSTSAEFTAFMHREYARWGELVRKNDIKIE